MVTKRYHIEENIVGFQPKYTIHDLTEKQFLLLRDLLGITSAEPMLYDRMHAANSGRRKNMFIDVMNGYNEVDHITVEER